MLGTLGSRVWGKCTYCRHNTWVWVITPTELFCNNHVALAEEFDKRFQDHVELERV